LEWINSIVPIEIMATGIPGGLLRSIHFVDGSIRERYHEQIAIRSGLDIGADTEASADQKALAFRDVELSGIIRNPIFKPRIAGPDF
jgi:hypothetical protein